MIIDLKKYKEHKYINGVFTVIKKLFLSLNQPLLADLFTSEKTQPVYSHYPKYLINQLDGVDLCTNCSVCVDVCPTDAIEIINEKGVFEGPMVKAPWQFLLDLEKCVKCGYCVVDCPENALGNDQEFNRTKLEGKIVDLKKMTVESLKTKGKE